MRVLVWQWGRRGAGPRYAVELTRALRRSPGVTALLSLSTGAEIMAEAPDCDLPVETYAGLAGWALRLLTIPLAAPTLARRLRALQLDGAVCAMPAPLDLLMATALRRAGVPYAVTVHDATLHPGDIFPMQAVLQRRLLRGAAALVALSGHVAGQLGERRPVLRARLSPLAYGPPPPAPRQHGGAPRLLSFGRLLPYKGLDLLADALARVGPGRVSVRVVGSGPESPELDALRRLPWVALENRWAPEAEVGDLLAWADALVLSHREASQSGVAAAALAAGRLVVATNVGGLPEQLAGRPGTWLCEPDGAALAAAIEAMLAAPPYAAPVDDGWHGSVDALAADLAAVFRSANAPAPATARRTPPP